MKETAVSYWRWRWRRCGFELAEVLLSKQGKRKRKRGPVVIGLLFRERGKNCEEKVPFYCVFLGPTVRGWNY